MENFGILLRIPDFSYFDRSFILGQLHANAEEIARTILERIEDRSPVDTGALKEDETYELPNGGGQSQPLVTWFVGDEYQIAENKRYYAPYQEGPPLGLKTYTTGEHQMFFKVSSEDIPLIADWAQRVVDDAVEQTIQAADAGAIEDYIP